MKLKMQFLPQPNRNEMQLGKFEKLIKQYVLKHVNKNGNSSSFVLRDLISQYRLTALIWLCNLKLWIFHKTQYESGIYIFSRTQQCISKPKFFQKKINKYQPLNFPKNSELYLKLQFKKTIIVSEFKFLFLNLNPLQETQHCKLNLIFFQKTRF